MDELEMRRAEVECLRKELKRAEDEIVKLELYIKQLEQIISANKGDSNV